MTVKNIKNRGCAKLLTLAAAAGLSFVLAAPAIAQLDEIMVTARKTSENLNDVPVTVAAIGAQTIERFNYTKIENLVARVPSMNVQIGGSGSGAQVTLRGVGSANISAAFDSAVAFNFDGMVISTMRILHSSFFDTQQIEVLKGPQALYFGKSASAGVISIKSAGATDELEVGGKVSYELEERGYTVETYISGPISDTLGFRIAARFNDITRQYYNSAPVADPKRGQENYNIRATLEWEPTDNFDANLKLNWVRHTNDGAIGNVYKDCGPNGVADPIALFAEAFLLPAGYNCDQSGDVYWQPDGAPPLWEGNVPFTPINEGVPFGASTIYFGILTTNYDFNDSLTLTTVTGFLDQNAYDTDWYSYGGYCDAATAPCWVFPQADNQSFGQGGGITNHVTEQFTQEIRLASDYDAPVNFMFGLFYEDRHTEFNTNQYAVNIALLAGPDAATGFTSDWYKRHLYDMEAVSIFGSITWDITDSIEFSSGVRWTKEKKTNNIVVPYVHAALVGPAFIASGFESPDIDFEDQNVSPEATITWKATEDVNVYFAYKTGFKSGGIDNSALPSANLLGFGSADPAVRQATADGLIYASETAKGFEGGVKATLLNRTLQFNLSGFYYEFDNLQVQNFDSVAIQFQTSNAGEVTSKGIDLDFNWATPLEGLAVFGAAAFTSTKFTSPFDPNPNNGVLENIEGRATARAPKWSGHIAVDYRKPLGNALEFGMSGNMAYSSSYFSNEDTLDNDIVQGDYVTLTLLFRLAAKMVGGK
jgi:iron complex outermembrane receptor protein